MTVLGLVGTFPPTRCGIATFTEALATALAARDGSSCRVVRVDDLVPTRPATPGDGITVVGELRPGSSRSRTEAARALTSCDAVLVQHEFGIYGGPEGDEVLELLALIDAPSIVVLHTVREAPTPRQREVIHRIGALASTLVVMTHAAGDLLAEHYSVPMAKVRMIPHGTPDWGPIVPAEPTARPVILTWGLLGPGKGIEWGIRALDHLRDVWPRPLYRIAGQTHPKVLATDGEAYRIGLRALAEDLGVSGDVEIDGRYRGVEELAQLVATADVVLLPYDSREQTTSGVLAEAVAAGKPVIATPFPHAIELLAGGAGAIVGHGDARAIAARLRALLGPDGVVGRAEFAAHRRPDDTTWSSVAAQYLLVARSLAGASAA